MEKFLEKHLDKIIWVICGILYTLLAFGIYSHFHKQSFGQSVPNAPAQFETSLAVPQATTDTVATLATGYLLPGTVCLTVDSNTSLSEYECGTASTTDPTLIYNITRGIDTSYGTSSVASNIYPHRVGADVRVTDFPVIQQFSNIFNGIQGITNPILYSGVSTSTLGTNNNYLATVGYANSIAVAGAPNASLSQQGLVQQGTALQMAASVGTGSTGAQLFPSGSLFASSSSATTLIPVTQTNGKLNQNFLDLTQNYTWTGFATSATTTILGILTATNATSTLAATTSKALVLDGVNYFFPNSQGAASTTLTNDGSGNLSWQPKFSYLNSTTTAIATSWTNTTGSTTVASLSVTVPTAERLMVTHVGTVGVPTQSSCQLTLYIDNVSQSVVYNEGLGGSTATTLPGTPANFTYITGQLICCYPHLNFGYGVDSNGSGTCSYTINQLSVINAGN